MIAINYWAVIVAAIVQMLLGSLWYGPLFGKAWTKLNGMSDSKMQGMKAKGMGGSYVFMLIGALLMSWVLAVFINSAEAHYLIWTATYGIHIALYMWLGFAVPLTLTPTLWEGKPWTLWLLNVCYYLVGLCLMGAILGAWH